MHSVAEYSTPEGGGFAFAGSDFRFPTYDPTSQQFFTRAAVSSPEVKQRHELVVRWHKAEALWNDLWLWYGADAGAMHDIGGGTLAPAQDGETVRAWLNRRSATLDLGQTTGANQPLWSADTGSGSRAVVADGVNANFRIDSVPSFAPPFTLVVYGRDLCVVGGANQRTIARLGWPSGYMFESNSAGVMRSWEWQGGVSKTLSSGISGVGKAVWALVVSTGLNVGIYHTSTGLVWLGTSTLATMGQVINVFDQGTAGTRASGELGALMLYHEALSGSQLVALDGVLQSEYVL